MRYRCRARQGVLATAGKRSQWVAYAHYFDLLPIRLPPISYVVDMWLSLIAMVVILLPSTIRRAHPPNPPQPIVSIHICYIVYIKVYIVYTQFYLWLKIGNEDS